MPEINTLASFYDLMLATVEVRSSAVMKLLDGHEVDVTTTKALEKTLKSLENIPKHNSDYYLEITKNHSIVLNLDYEIQELYKDLFFLTNNRDLFLIFLAKQKSNFQQQVDKGINYLSGIKFSNLLTDRDGTINNYCGRYASSVQSIYNAYYLTKYARNCVTNATVLTSAPLKDIGLVDISVAPQSDFIYAASKGREYIDSDGKYNQYPIESAQQNMCNTLNTRLKELLQRPEYSIFALIGSGLQFKFGQTTIARQDINNSITSVNSNAFLLTIKQLVQELDPENQFFRIEDTGKDIEIILTIPHSDKNKQLKDFDKGDGLEFLDGELGLQFVAGPNLICGDTASDIPMFQTSVSKNKETCSIFVTEDEDLKKRVLEISSRAYFVDRPDILIAIFGTLAAE